MWQTDWQTDRILLAIPRLHYMQRGNNFWALAHLSSSLCGILYWMIFIHIHIVQNFGHSSCYLLVSEQTFAKWRCSKLCAIFSVLLSSMYLHAMFVLYVDDLWPVDPMPPPSWWCDIPEIGSLSTVTQDQNHPYCWHLYNSVSYFCHSHH